MLQGRVFCVARLSVCTCVFLSVKNYRRKGRVRDKKKEFFRAQREREEGAQAQAGMLKTQRIVSCDSQELTEKKKTQNRSRKE